MDLVRDGSEVSCVSISYLTTKVGSKKDIQNSKIVARRSDEESQLLDDIVEWVKRGEIEGGEKVFTIKVNKERPRLLRSCEVAKAVKDSAARLGLPQQHFSTSSARKVFANQMDLPGVSKEERNAVGGWAEKSSVPDKHYSRAGDLRGDFAVLGESRMSLGDLKRIVPFV